MTEIYIHDEVAYEEGRERNIRRNAKIGRAKRWLAADETRKDLVEFLKRESLRATRQTFLTKMYDSLEQWGSLTEGQEAAVRKCIAQRAEAAVKRVEERKADAEISQHVGSVGVRQRFDLVVQFVLSLESVYGLCYVHVCKDAAGNVVVYKGSKALGAKGEAIAILATIKEHGMRDGVRQTAISRPAAVKS